MSVVLITGCSSGIGLESALAFARRGDTVVATMRNLAKSDRLLERANSEGLEVTVSQLDVTDEASIEAVVGGVAEAHGSIDVVVNNAGVANRGPVETQSLDNAMTLMDTNFWGPIRVARAVLPVMRAQRSGVVINVTSLAGRIPGTAFQGMYGASKHALGALSEALALEVEPFGIRVAVIEPGFFATEIADNNLSADEALSPAYAADQEWLASYFESNVESGADAAVVAAAIVAAAQDPDTSLHVPVGDDAAMVLALYESVASYEDWLQVAIPIVEEIAGPRPSH